MQLRAERSEIDGEKPSKRRDRFHEIGRLIPLAAAALGREVRGVGFDDEMFDGNAAKRQSQALGAGVGDRGVHPEEKSQSNKFLGLFGVT